MSKKSVRENFKGLLHSRKTDRASSLIKAAKLGSSVGSAAVRGALALGKEATDAMLDVAQTADFPSTEELVAEDGQEAVAEAHHEIDELNEVRGEVMVRGISRDERNADLNEIANRLGEAESNLARAVEAGIQETGHAQQPRPKGPRELFLGSGKKSGLPGKLRRR